MGRAMRAVIGTGDSGSPPSPVSRSSYLSEAIDLWRAEGRAWRMVLGHGPANAKLARYYEVRRDALGMLCRHLFQN